MKKLLLTVLAIFLITTVFNAVGFAQGKGGKGKGKRSDLPRIPSGFGRTNANAPGNSIVDLSKGTVNQKIGLIKHDPKRAFQGYTLFAPKHYITTHLIDMEGREINSWKSSFEPGQSVYLLENGNLLHCCMTKNKNFIGGGEGGKIEEYNWEGDLVWELWYSDSEKLAHHDIEPLPNGNILLMVVELKTKEECIAAGFKPSAVRQGRVFPEYIVEIERQGATGAKVVWEWHIWDHLVQNIDPSKENYGEPKDHPELLNVNSSNRRGVRAFWNHANSIDYNPELDQIILSARGQSEFWVIDHSTTTKEAAGHTGGKYGKGGDILYRWGNPAMYGAGSRKDQKLFLQHDCQWIPSGFPGAGNIMIFNNGKGRGYSSVDEIVPPVDENGFYAKLKPGEAHGPKEQLWIYTAKNPKDLYSTEISGASRLPNGNTLVCDGVHGRFIELTPAEEIVWEYICPFDGRGPLKQGDPIYLDPRGHQMNAVFKVRRYAPDYPAFKGRDMTPGKLIEGM